MATTRVPAAKRAHEHRRKQLRAPGEQESTLRSLAGPDGLAHSTNGRACPLNERLGLFASTTATPTGRVGRIVPLHTHAVEQALRCPLRWRTSLFETARGAPLVPGRASRPSLAPLPIPRRHEDLDDDVESRSRCGQGNRRKPGRARTLNERTAFVLAYSGRPSLGLRCLPVHEFDPLSAAPLVALQTGLLSTWARSHAAGG